MKTNNGTNSQATNKQEQANPFRGLYRTISWAYVTNVRWRSKSPRRSTARSGMSQIMINCLGKRIMTQPELVVTWRGSYSGEALIATLRFKSATGS
jgi:hypothetical protein